MDYFTTPPKPKILLVNFTKEDFQNLLKEGFNVELGLITSLKEGEKLKKLEYYFESPPFEYDIFIYNSDFKGDFVKFIELFPKRLNLHDNLKERLEDFKVLNNCPFITAFIGENVNNDNLVLGGLPNFNIKDADPRLKELIVAEPGGAFVLNELPKFINKHKADILPIKKYIISDEVKNRYTYYHFPLIVNRQGEQIATYTTTYQGRTILTELVLPQFKNNLEVLKDLLGLLIDLRPELFPEIKKIDWIDSDEFAFDEVVSIKNEIIKKIKDAEQFITEKQKLITEKEKELSFIKKILTTKGDDELKPSVIKALESFDFKVVDSDKEIQKGKKKQDLIVSDTSGYEALVEIKGTTRQNVPEYFYSQLLTHLRKAHNSNLRGTLIVNYDADTHPFKRIPIYKDAQELFSEESDIGVLSTVELYKILIAFRKGIITKEKAREIIKKPNRIVFDLEGIISE